MLKRFARRISQTHYVRSAMAEQADLSMFKQKPTPRVIWGLVVIGISYTIGWPVIAMLGVLAAYLDAPLILIIGGPLFYGLSHLTFMLGAYLAGVQYAQSFFRWATRIAVQKLTE